MRPEPGSGFDISRDCRGPVWAFLLFKRQNAMAPTAMTTTATPIPMPAAAPDEMPEAGAGDDAGDVSPAVGEVLEGIVPACFVSVLARQRFFHTHR